MQTNDPATIVKPATRPWTTMLPARAIIPATVVCVIACAIIGMIGFIAVRAVQTHGLLPRATQLDHYACAGFVQPVQIAFRHGLEVMQLQTGGRTIQGNLLNGRIEWQSQPGDPATAKTVMPTEVVYDDAHSVRLQANDHTEHRCTLIPRN
jgi:hypothetical protein